MPARGWCVGMSDHHIRTTALAVTLCLLGVGAAGAQDPLDQLSPNGGGPVTRPGYSDFTTPLGRFMDLLAADDIAGARAIRPAACADWSARRQESGWSGRFSVRGVMFDLDAVCAAH
jgi:hypothetical protein